MLIKRGIKQEKSGESFKDTQVNHDPFNISNILASYWKF